MNPLHLEVYDYSLNPPSAWEGYLDQMSGRKIRLPIRWGTHESTKSVRDFSRLTRLRLEKFLQLAHLRSVRLELEIGFFPGEESFPRWTWDLAPYDLIPLGVWESSGSHHEFLRVPSLSNAEVKQGFREFQEELFGILSLYHHPDGPIRNVILDPGIYQSCLSVTQYPDFARLLEQRYGTIGALNIVYSTHFKNFQSVAGHHGIRTLNDRRSWLAAFDYKFCQKTIFTELFRELTAESPIPIQIGETTATGLSEGLAQSLVEPIAVVFDDTQLGRSPEPFPLSLEGLSTYGASASFGFWSALQRDLAPLNIPLIFSSDLAQYTLAGVKTLVLATNRFLARSCFEACCRFIEAGGQLWFPFGLPQYDENLIALNWKSLPTESTLTLSDRVYRSFAKGAGQLFLPVAPLKFNPEVASDLALEVLAIAEKGVA